MQTKIRPNETRTMRKIMTDANMNLFILYVLVKCLFSQMMLVGSVAGVM